jgi:sec-independent protein translocase protein TatA
MDFLGIGAPELLLILIVALIVAGPAKVQEIARSLGKLVRAVRKAGADLTAGVSRELEEAKKDLPSGNLPSVTDLLHPDKKESAPVSPENSLAKANEHLDE